MQIIPVTFDATGGFLRSLLLAVPGESAFAAETGSLPLAATVFALEIRIGCGVRCDSSRSPAALTVRIVCYTKETST